MKHVPWTKLNGTPIWVDAMMNYADPRRDYHGRSHIESIYGHAEALGLAYDSALDLAILIHDVIIFSEEPERDSGVWLLEAMERHNLTEDPYVVDGVIAGDREDNIFTALRHITSTATHAIQDGESCELIVLDLMGFADKDQRRRDTEACRREAFAAKGTSEAEFDEGCILYLTGLQERLEAAVDEGLGLGFDVELNAILAGIGATIAELSAQPTLVH
jgi:predicted metal-dependent HD superfamily phosphohydrolase